MSEKSIQTVCFGVEPKNTVKFNEALNLTGFGKFNLLMTVLCGLMAVAIALETVGFSYILPAAQCDLGLTLTQKGWIGAIPFIGFIGSSLFWGYMADTRGRRKVLMISMTLGSICAMISSFSPNLVTFAILRLCSSALTSAANVVIFPYYGEFTPKVYIDSMISVLSSILIFSAVISTLIAWGVLSLDFDLPIGFLGISYKPWRLMIFCFAFPFVLTTLALIKAPESPKFLMSQGQDEKALKILRRMYRFNTGNDPSQYKVDTVILDDMDRIGLKNVSVWESLRSQTVPLFRPPLIKYILIFFVINVGMYACANGFFMWLPDIIDRFYIGLDEIDSDNKTFCELMSVRSDINQRNFVIVNETETPVCADSLNTSTYPMMITFTCVIGCCNILMAICLRFITKKTALMFLLGLCCSSGMVMHWIRSPWVSWVLLLFFQCCGVVIGVLNAYAVEVFPTNYRAMAISLMLMFGRVGSVAGTNLVGFLMEVCCPANFFGFSGLLFVCFICCTLLPAVKTAVKLTKL